MMLHTKTLVAVLIVLLGMALLYYSNIPAQSGKNLEQLTWKEIIDLGPPSLQVYEYAKLHADEMVPVELLLGHANAETTWRSVFDFSYESSSDKQVSTANAAGPMQVRVVAAKQAWKGTDKLLGMSDIEIFNKLRYDIDFNIETSKRYLVYLIKYYKGNLRLAVAAYHAGHATINTVDDIKYSYSSQVLSQKNRYKNPETILSFKKGQL